MMYLSQGVNMFSISVDEVNWDGDTLKLTAQLPTPEASATLSVFEGTLTAEGTIKGQFAYGLDAPSTMKMPSLAVPMVNQD